MPDHPNKPPRILGRVQIGGTKYLGIPGLGFHTVGTLALAADLTFYEPFYVEGPITLDQLNLGVTVAGAASSTARMGIYNADTNWQPTTLIVDAGTVLIDSTGHKTATVNVTLPIGRYLKALNLSAAATLRFLKAPNDMVGTTLFTSTPQITQWQIAAAALSSYPDPGTVWTGAGFDNSGIHHFVIPRVSAFA